MTDPTDDTPDLARAVEAVADEWAACGSATVYETAAEMADVLRTVLDKHRPHRSDRATQPTEAALTDGPDGVPGSTEPWASGLRGAVLMALLTSPWAADAGKIRAVLMGSLYAEVDRILAARKAAH